MGCTGMPAAELLPLLLELMVLGCLVQGSVVGLLLLGCCLLLNRCSLALHVS